jgi:hypothetical protein
MRSRELGCTCIARQTHSLFITMALRGVKNRTQTPACTSGWPNFPFEKHPHSHYDLLNEQPNTALARSAVCSANSLAAPCCLCKPAGSASSPPIFAQLAYYIMYSHGFSEMKKSHRRRMCPLPPPRLVTQFCYIHQVKCHMEMSRRVRTCMYSKYIHNDPRGMSVLSLVGMT